MGSPLVLPDIGTAPEPDTKIQQVLKLLLPSIAAAMTGNGNPGAFSGFENTFAQNEQQRQHDKLNAHTQKRQSILDQNNVAYRNQELENQQRRLTNEEASQKSAAANTLADNTRADKARVDAETKAAADTAAATQKEQEHKYSVLSDTLQKAINSNSFLKANLDDPVIANTTVLSTPFGNMPVEAILKIVGARQSTGMNSFPAVDEPLVPYRVVDNAGQTQESMVPKNDPRLKIPHPVSREAKVPTPKEPKASTRGFDWTDPETDVAYRIIEDPETGKEISRRRMSGGPAPMASHAAPPAPKGWKYVPKPGGGWTAVRDTTP